MSNITNSLNQRCFVLPETNFISNSQEEILKLIMLKHGVSEDLKIKLIDENDEYDSFLVETENNGFCVKLAFDSLIIFYDYMCISGLEHLQIAPKAIARGEIEYGKTIYYTIQSFEYSDNLMSIGGSSLLTDEHYNFYEVLNKLHLYKVNEEITPHLDDTLSYLEYHKLNFESFLEFVDNSESEDFSFIRGVYENTYNEMIVAHNQFSKNLTVKSLVHGHLDLKTIISNNFQFKFINFENCFYGHPFFDICNLVFEIQMNGTKEHDFVTKAIERLGLTNNRLTCLSLLKEYKICKYIWTRKIFLDLIKDYLKEVIILNKTRRDKMLKIGNEFQKHFYRFCDIAIFNDHKDSFVQKYNSLILN